MSLDDAAVNALMQAQHGDPFSVLGMHHINDTWVVRALVADAQAVTVLGADGLRWPARQRGDGLFEADITGIDTRIPYQLAVDYQHDDHERIIEDPYRFDALLNDFDLQRFQSGQHHHIETLFGAIPCVIDGVAGTRFAVWAPAAQRVSVVGNWNQFDGRWHPMRLRKPFGVWELFIPGIQSGQLYKYEILSPTGELRIKADPYAQQAELPPATASIVPDGYNEHGALSYDWNDTDWMEARLHRDIMHEPMSVYEVHIGSWKRKNGDEYLSYRELSSDLIDHCKTMGFTHIEFLPLAQHPYEGSWGYQVTGQFAPNSRHGSGDDLRYLIDRCHQAGIGVIVDFVPGHFPKDDFSLALFDGTPCYEYADPREGEHKEWGTKIFNYRRPEVRNFLLGAALFWLRHYHIDGIRVDAVSSMLYRNYDRDDGEWVANEHGGMENLEAVNFFQELNALVGMLFKGVVTIAEESTAWPNVTVPTDGGGLGFHMKWNMGWMHDTLRYLKQDPVMRPGCHDWITFHQWYAYDEKWVLPLSHDEVVHGKGSLLDKMTCSSFTERIAQLRLLYGYQIAVPGRPLLFQGAEYGQGREWAWQRSIDWHEAAEPERQDLMSFLARALRCYRQYPALHAADDDRHGFRWVDCDNRQESMLAFLRQAPGERSVLVVANFTPVPRPQYPLGVDQSGNWIQILHSDSSQESSTITTESGQDGWHARLRCDVPAFGLVYLLAPML